MENIEFYNFKYFTITNYRDLIRKVVENNFNFSLFHEEFPANTKQILWRHDVEFSPFDALTMAEIEAEEGVKATYFFQLHGECYNVLEKDISNIVLKIKLLGHDIGLHFDSHYFNISDEETLEKYLMIDKQYFNEIFGVTIKVFSFHETNAFILSCIKAKYAGLLNVYSNYFMKNFKYCTDSTGFWRYENLSDLLENPDITKLQVLTHDAMWSSEILPPRQRVFNSIDKNAHRVKLWYDQTLTKFGAKNVDWNSVF